ncbi:uncharacterized protein LOC113214930 isoform X2 [Frankliniella occidentalis]|uniref:Uncharacterized protein LOC113214930 isoform X2 n=1 Tax=Frankliniella occidentalis TaxID=133901 RepID=A0A6J1THB2_FRAOC|nr:uncharacterized protein LOC113214930 isoform X2 [Frankliniella occidentalis]
MASAMRLKHSVGPLTAVESRLNYSNLQDSNSNEANFNDSAIWDTIRPVSILEESVAKCRPCPYGSQAGRLDNRRSGAARTAPRNISPGGNRNEPRDSNLAEDNCYLTRDYASRPTDNHRPPASTSSSTSSCYSSASSSCSASPLGSPASPIEGGIVNPNYPGFEHLAAKLLRLAAGSDYEDQDEDDEDNNNNIINENVNGKQLQYQDDGKRIDPINHDHADGNKALLYAKPKLAAAMADAFLSSAKEDLAVSRDFQKQAKLHKMSVHGPPIGALGALAARHYKKDSNRALEEREEEEEKYNREATEKELQQDIVVPRKKEKMAMNQQVRKARAGPPAMGFDRAERTERAEKRFSSHVHAHAHAHGQAASRREKRSSLELLGGFDVYNIETAMPRIDLDLIESHLRAAKEEERRRRNDREEIRRRLAMGSEDADYYSNDQRPGKKPSLQARLQSGMNLQICFMNETLSDTESPGSESENPSSGPSGLAVAAKASSPKTESASERLPGGSLSSKPARPLSLPLRLDANHEWREHSSLMTEADFLARQAQLQTEARMALAQAKDMAHMQMEIERQRQNASPITEMVRHTLQKVGVSFPEDRRRLSRQILTEMNVAQLQVIVNDLHTQIEYLNESLVRFLMERDDLHMEQDSMLVDIEDLTRYLGAKEQSSKAGPNLNNNLIKSNGTSGGGRMNSKK